MKSVLLSLLEMNKWTLVEVILLIIGGASGLSQTCPNSISSGKPFIIPSAMTTTLHNYGEYHSHR